MPDRHESYVLQMGHIDADGAPVGWVFLLNHLSPAHIAWLEREPNLMQKARFAGWSKKAIREVWLHVRRN